MILKLLITAGLVTAGLCSNSPFAVAQEPQSEATKHQIELEAQGGEVATSQFDRIVKGAEDRQLAAHQAVIDAHATYDAQQVSVVEHQAPAEAEVEVEELSVVQPETASTEVAIAPEPQVFQAQQWDVVETTPVTSEVETVIAEPTPIAVETQEAQVAPVTLSQEVETSVVAADLKVSQPASSEVGEVLQVEVPVKSAQSSGTLATPVVNPTETPISVEAHNLQATSSGTVVESERGRIGAFVTANPDLAVGGVNGEFYPTENLYFSGVAGSTDQGNEFAHGTARWEPVERVGLNGTINIDGSVKLAVDYTPVEWATVWTSTTRSPNADTSYQHVGITVRPFAVMNLTVHNDGGYIGYSATF